MDAIGHTTSQPTNQSTQLIGQLADPAINTWAIWVFGLFVIWTFGVHIIQFSKVVFSRVLRDSTTRFVGPSVRRSVGLSVRPSVTLYFFGFWGFLASLLLPK